MMNIQNNNQNNQVEDLDPELLLRIIKSQDSKARQLLIPLNNDNFKRE